MRRVRATRLREAPAGEHARQRFEWTQETMSEIRSAEQVGSAGDGRVADGSTVRQYLTFLLDGEEYAVDIIKVQEIKGWSTATPIPNTRDFVCGAINMRGTIVPVFDMRLRFGLAATDYGPTTVVIVVKAERPDGNEHIVGMVVDAVSDVHNLPDRALQPAPGHGTGIGTAYVRGLASADDKMVIVLDIDRLVVEGVLDDAMLARH